MTDTPEAVRLAELLSADPTESPVSLAAAALLRRIPELEAERDQLRAALSATQPAQAQQAGEAPLGAIVNGRIHIERLEMEGFEDGHGHRMTMCTDWHELRRCFEHLADWASSTTPPAPAQPAAPPTKVANPYSGVGQVSEGWCRANPGLAAMAINRLSAWLNELQQDQAAGPPPTPPAQQGETT